MEATGLLGAKLSLELAKVDEELERIEKNLCSLRKQKRSLLERKAQVTLIMYYYIAIMLKF